MGLYIGDTKYMPIVGGIGGKVANRTPFYDAEIEYLEADGYSYIDTGVYGTGSTVFNCEFCCSSDALPRPLGENGTVWNDNCFYVSWTASNNPTISFFYYNTSKSIRNTNVLDGNWHTITFDGNTKFTYDNKSTTFTHSNFTTTQTIYLFGVHSRVANSGGLSHQANHIKIRKIQIGGLDLIPVRVGSVGYMFDKATGRLFGNSGSGNFILGNDI